MSKTILGRASSWIINFIMVIILLITLYPFWHVVMYSISDTVKAMDGGLFFIPKGFSLESYRVLLKNDAIFRAYKNSIIVTTVGTTINVSMTALLAYPLSIKRFEDEIF